MHACFGKLSKEYKVKKVGIEKAFMFGERSGVVVDPAQEKLQSLFADVTRSFIPLHAVIRIDEVNTPGTGKITDSKASNITPFPYPPAPTKK